jgi:thiosulfate/3-mercaptopyruvate sulfurtransferase
MQASFGGKMNTQLLLQAQDVARFEGVIIDCRFDLMNPAAGREVYAAGHLPGALFLDLEEDLSLPRAEHGGRHPLPSPAAFAARLAALGIVADTPVLIYDDSRSVFAARLWWMLRGLGYGPLCILSGGFSAWLRAGGTAVDDVPEPAPAPVPVVPARWPLYCDRSQLRDLQEQGAQLVDAREAVRYRGESEHIDPVAGHIPGADNRPWQALTADDGQLRSESELRALWGDLLAADQLVVYCGSGVSACLNILSLATLGRDDVWLYGGSWSDWCSYL